VRDEAADFFERPEQGIIVRRRGEGLGGCGHASFGKQEACFVIAEFAQHLHRSARPDSAV